MIITQPILCVSGLVNQLPPHGVCNYHCIDKCFDSIQLSGFPINMSFTDMPPVSEAVFSTGVHSIEDPDVEFALAVHIHPYPQGVFSLWIYVGTLRRKAGY